DDLRLEAARYLLTLKYGAEEPAEKQRLRLRLLSHSPPATQRVLAIQSLYEALSTGTLPASDSFAVNALQARMSSVSEEDADVLGAVYADPSQVIAVLGAKRATELVHRAGSASPPQHHDVPMDSGRWRVLLLSRSASDDQLVTIS
ncbi:unnamed protein product, partial [Tilletia laevis]